MLVDYTCTQLYNLGGKSESIESWRQVRRVDDNY